MLIKCFDLANPKNAFPIRAVYGAIQFLNLVALLYIHSCILRNKERGSVTVVVPPTPFTTEEELKSEIISVQEHDERELNGVFLQIVVIAIILISVHMWLQPLILQAFLSPLILCNLGRVHILKQTAEGKLARPWKNGYALAEFLHKWDQVQEEEGLTVMIELQEIHGEAEEEPQTRSSEAPASRIRPSR